MPPRVGSNICPSMDVFLLSAGFGTRLKPITNRVPKCLAPVGDIPLLAIWLYQLSQLHFVSRVYINAHYLSDQVKDFLARNRFNLNIQLIIEDAILGTSESIRSTMNKSTADEFMIIHSDNFSLQDFGMMYRLFLEKSSISRLSGVALGFRSEDYHNSGFFSYNKKSGQINSFIEKPGCHVEGVANGAILMVTRELLRMSFEDSGRSDFCKDNLPLMVDCLFLFEASGVHIDIGNPAALAWVQCYRDFFSNLDLDSSWHQEYNKKIGSLER